MLRDGAARAGLGRELVAAPDRHQLHLTLYTVGHSTRTLDALVEVLRPAGVAALVDVRRAPHSRRHPQFDRDALARSLPDHGVDYRHEQALGGFRRASPDSPNKGWEHPAFRGYADYMATPEFARALARLESDAAERATCVMCAEAQWWRCHRRLIADAVTARGGRVLHLGLSVQPREHELTPFAVRQPGGGLLYPPAQMELGPG